MNNRVSHASAVSRKSLSHCCSDSGVGVAIGIGVDGFLKGLVSYGAAEFYSSGSPDIDRMRAEGKVSGATADKKGALLLFVWLGILQQPRFPAASASTIRPD